MENKKINNCPDLSNKAISDDELEQVTGGVLYQPKTCAVCGTVMWQVGTPMVCPKGHPLS